MASRVVPGMSDTIVRASPRSAFSSDDLPTLGRPTKAIAGGSSLSAAIAASQRGLGSRIGDLAGERDGIGGVRVLVVPSSRRRRQARRLAPPRTASSVPARMSVAQASASSSRASRARSGLALGRQRPDDGVQQVRHAAAVRGRDGVGLLPAQRVELGGLELALLVVGLVGARRAPASCERRRISAASSSAGVRPVIGVDHEHDHVRLDDRDPRLLLDPLLDRVAGVDLDAAGVDDDEPPAVPLGVAVQPVAGGPGPVLDDRRALADDAVEQRALAHVRPADDGDDRQPGARVGHGGQAAPAAGAAGRRGSGSEVVRPAGVAAESSALCASSAAWARVPVRAVGAGRASRIRSATSRRSSMGVEVPPVTPTTCDALEERRVARGRGRSRSGRRACRRCSHSRVSSLVFAELRPPTTIISSTLFGRPPSCPAGAGS